ncbi:peptidylprolyl isomerase [Cryomorphaceae bacterium]|nr:peptidylprolyl isomerase [Cryomorphaceae bacterium]
MSQVKQNDTVRVHYTGTLADGEIFDSSREREPLEFTLGQGQLIPGFENGVIDMKTGETKTVHIPAAEAYGERREEMIQEVPKDQLPEEIKPEVGMTLFSRTPDGREMPLIVSEVLETSIMVDANHPLAGKDLTFEIELVEIK